MQQLMKLSFSEIQSFFHSTKSDASPLRVEPLEPYVIGGGSGGSGGSTNMSFGSTSSTTPHHLEARSVVQVLSTMHLLQFLTQYFHLMSF